MSKTDELDTLKERSRQLTAREQRENRCKKRTEWTR